MPPSPDIEDACKTLRALRRQLDKVRRAGGRSLSLLQAAADDCADAILVTNPKARIVMVNGPAARLLGTSTRELQSLTLWDITHTSYQSDFEVLWKEFLRAGRQRGRSGIRHADGSVVEVAYCAEVDIVQESCLFVLRRLD